MNTDQVMIFSLLGIFSQVWIVCSLIFFQPGEELLLDKQTEERNYKQ